MNIQQLHFTIGFWHPFGPHAGETTQEIILRKRGEIQNNGWTLWSFQFRNTLELWYQEIKKANPEHVLVFCSEGKGARDPMGTPRLCNYFLPVGELTPRKIPAAIQIPHPLGTRTKGSAFIVKNIISPVDSEAIPIEWFKGGQWQTTQLPTRPEYLIQPGHGLPVRRYCAVLELQVPYLAEIGVV